MGDEVREGRTADASMSAPSQTWSEDRERSAFKFNDQGHDEGLAGLLRDLAHQGAHLAEQQTKLVTAEMRSAASDLKESVAALVGAAVVGIAGLGVLLMSVAFLLGTAMPLWAATMIVAV